MRSNSAKCGHVKRRLIRGERLTGNVLEFALSLVEEGCNGNSETSRLCKSIYQKISLGFELSEYELHLMLDVFLFHKKLAGREADRERKAQ